MMKVVVDASDKESAVTYYITAFSIFGVECGARTHETRPKKSKCNLLI